MRIISLVLFVCPILAPPASAATFPSAPGGPLSLKEAVQYALENSPTFDAVKKTQLVRDLEYKNTIAKLLPSLDFTTTNGLQNNVPIASANTANTVITSNPSAPWYSSLNLGITENLYDNGVALTNISIADLKRELASATLKQTRESLTLDVATEFYRFSLATVLLEVRKQQQTTLDKQFRTLTSQYQQGFKTRSDYLRFKTQVQRSEIERITAESSITQSEANLQKLLGVSYLIHSATAFDPIQVNRSLKSGTLFSSRPPLLESTYDYRIAKIQEELNGKSVTLAKRNNWPQVSVSSGVNYLNQNYLNSDTAFSAGHQLSWNALLTLQYNLWDWGSRRRDVEISGYNRDIQDDTSNDHLLNITAQLSGLMADLTRISKNYVLTQELLMLEEESNRDLETQYREGKMTYLDLVTELNNLLDAKIQFFTSYFDALTYVAKYKYYEGTLYESFMEK